MQSFIRIRIKLIDDKEILTYRLPKLLLCGYLLFEIVISSTENGYITELV